MYEGYAKVFDSSGSGALIVDEDFFERDARLFLEWLDRARKTEPCVIAGVVEPDGECALWSKGVGSWWQIDLDCWRVASGPIREARWRVVYPLGSSRDVDAPRVGIDAGGLIRLTGRIAEHAEQGEMCLLDSLAFETPCDQELIDVASSLNAPFVIRDDAFGKFRRNRSLRHFEGRARVGLSGGAVKIRIHALTEAEARDGLSALSSLVDKHGDFLAEAASHAADDLVGLYNSSWSDSERALSPEKLRKQLRASTLLVHGDGAFSLVFNAK